VTKFKTLSYLVAARN